MLAKVAPLLDCQLSAQDNDVRNESQEAGEISFVLRPTFLRHRCYSTLHHDCTCKCRDRDSE